MSKISLEPNASGAGTFTLAAPNSNTNRALSLPDEAGKLLSTGNNDPAEVFKQSNILGTVSESSGVPTGAIIEGGSNSNGEFVKYADGTMICTRQNLTMNYRSSNRMNATWSFPASFASGTKPATNLTLPTFNSVNFLNVSGGNTGRMSVRHWGTSGFGLSNTETPLTVFFEPETVDDDSSITECSVIAIGRWF